MKLKNISNFQLVAEYFFCLLICAALAHMVWYFFEYGYLRQPFYYEPSGTWMDWFSLSYYAHHAGAYDVEKTIYPPLSFVIMRVLSVKHCYDITRSEQVRPCDWLGEASLIGFWVIAVIVAFLTFYKIDRRTAFPRAFALGFGFPMLYGFERGNLVIIAFIFYLLAFGPLLPKARWRWFCAGVVVNLKVYMIAAILAPLLRRRWLMVEGMVAATLIIYLGSWWILGEGSPQQVLDNLTSYSDGFGAQNVLDLWFPSSLVPVRTLMNSNMPLETILSSEQISGILFAVTAVTYLGQGLALAAALAAWLRPEVVPTSRLILFGAAIALSSKEAGGYTEILLMFSIFSERWRGFGRIFSIILAYLLCIPDDFVLGKLPPLVRDSFLSGHEVIAEFGVGVVALFRPAVILVIVMSLALVTLRDVWKDIANQGWHSRWRFRRDAPILPGQKLPVPSSAYSEG